MSTESSGNLLNLNPTEWIEIQGSLLTGKLSRIQISEMLDDDLKELKQDTVNVRVWRNFAGEPMANAFRVLGLYWGISYELEFMGYDDSFSFVELLDVNVAISIEVILIDRSHYEMSDDAFTAWIKDREDYLTTVTGNAVVTVIAAEEIVYRFGGMEVSRVVSKIANQPLFDSRYEQISGSRLTPKAHFLIARELAATWVGSTIAPPKKLLVVDLDFTLHDGILGESQLNIKITEGYLALQEQLIAAKRRGFMLAIISKNDLKDVLDLLASQSMYLLNENDFVSIEASWESKCIAMSKILEKTRVNEDSVIFIDDNPVELLQMKAVYPSISLVSAAEGPDVAGETLRYLPGFQRQKGDDLGDTRIRDIQSNEERLELIQNGLNAYYQSAKPQVKISIQDEKQLERLVDLARRSNQFNLTLARAGIENYRNDESTWVGLGLVDHFNDSGVIGGILLKKLNPEECLIQELFLSCRVLGRGLENSLICQGILAGIKKLGSTRIRLTWTMGERNDPALKWLANTFLEDLPATSGQITISVVDVENLAVTPQGVEVEIKD